MNRFRSISFRLLFLLFVCLVWHKSYSSQNPDSLLLKVKNTEIGEEKVNLLNRLASCYILSNLDSAFFYAGQAQKLSKEIEYKYGEALGGFYIGSVHSSKGDYGKATEILNKSLEIYQEIENQKGVGSCYNTIGLVFWNQGNYERAIENFLKSLDIQEELGDKMGMSNALGNIGIIHADQKNFKSAIEYYEKTLKIKKEIRDNEGELKDKVGIATCYNNLGTLNNDMGEYEKALEYCLNALEMYKLISDQMGISISLGNIGLIYKNQDKNDKAVEYYQKSLRIAEQIGDQWGIASSCANIALLNINLAENDEISDVKRTSYLKLAVHNGRSGIKLAREIGAYQVIKTNANALQKAYKMLGDDSEALKFAEIFIESMDSLFSLEKTQVLTEMEMKYNSEKKQLEIEKLEKQQQLDSETIARKNLENDRQKTILISAISLIGIILLSLVFLLRMFSQKKRANKLLEQSNQEILIQRDMVRDQKEEIESSITYAKRIQHALLPSRKLLEELFKEHFVLYKPKDIVSGDFFWVAKINKYIVITVVDCTGHGVPGAFMSILGMSFLNEIVRRKEVMKAGQVLDNLREMIIDSLGQSDQYESTNIESQGVTDGMDMGLCIIDTETLQLQFAGANNPMYHIRDNELTEINGDKMPVSVHIRMDKFRNHEIQLISGDRIFLLTDGYADQFGGPSINGAGGKKFKYKPIKDLLIENSSKPIIEQKLALEATLNDWMSHIDPYDGKEYQQVDDITIVGLKI